MNDDGVNLIIMGGTAQFSLFLLWDIEMSLSSIETSTIEPTFLIIFF